MIAKVRTHSKDREGERPDDGGEEGDGNQVAKEGPHADPGGEEDGGEALAASGMFVEHRDCLKGVATECARARCVSHDAITIIPVTSSRVVTARRVSSTQCSFRASSALASSANIFQIPDRVARCSNKRTSAKPGKKRMFRAPSSKRFGLRQIFTRPYTPKAKVDSHRR